MNRKSELGVYVHWPFCKAKCPYCDFNSHVRLQGVDAADFSEHIVRELTYLRSLTGPRDLQSIFFGGGTPSLMPAEAVDRILKSVDKLWGISSGVEITLEANPTSVEARNFKGYRQCGVNRISVGVQALNDEDLLRLGRQHSASEALAAFRLAREIFPRVSFDLIYARPGQSLGDWEKELAIALAEQAGHMSLYQLTIEPDTVYHSLYHAGRLAVPDDEHSVALYQLTQSMTASAGLRAYEISNHARVGDESRHNLTYWRYGDYVGAGPGAHGRLTMDNERFALSTARDPDQWRRLVAAHGHAIVEHTLLSPSDQALELLIMGMRISEGINMDDYADLAGKPLIADRVTEMIEAGMITEHEGNIAATPHGRRVLNSVIVRLAGL